RIMAASPSQVFVLAFQVRQFSLRRKFAGSSHPMRMVTRRLSPTPIRVHLFFACLDFRQGRLTPRCRPSWLAGRRFFLWIRAVPANVRFTASSECRSGIQANNPLTLPPSGRVKKDLENLYSVYL